MLAVWNSPPNHQRTIRLLLVKKKIKREYNIIAIVHDWVGHSFRWNNFLWCHSINYLFFFPLRHCCVSSSTLVWEPCSLSNGFSHAPDGRNNNTSGIRKKKKSWQTFPVLPSITECVHARRSYNRVRNLCAPTKFSHGTLYILFELPSCQKRESRRDLNRNLLHFIHCASVRNVETRERLMVIIDE
jgi:hypothetical protein